MKEIDNHINTENYNLNRTKWLETEMEATSYLPTHTQNQIINMFNISIESSDGSTNIVSV